MDFPSLSDEHVRDVLRYAAYSAMAAGLSAIAATGRRLSSALENLPISRRLQQRRMSALLLLLLAGLLFVVGQWYFAIGAVIAAGVAQRWRDPDSPESLLRVPATVGLSLVVWPAVLLLAARDAIRRQISPAAGEGPGDSAASVASPAVEPIPVRLGRFVGRIMVRLPRPLRSGIALLQLCVAGTLLLAITRQPIGYYSAVKWLVLPVAILCAVRTWRQRDEAWFWLFVAILVLFNPVFPLHFERQIWQLLDLAAALVFLARIRVGTARRTREDTVARKVDGLGQGQEQSEARTPWIGHDGRYTDRPS